MKQELGAGSLEERLLPVLLQAPPSKNLEEALMWICVGGGAVKPCALCWSQYRVVSCCVCVLRACVCVCVRGPGHLPQSSHIPLCCAAGAEWVYAPGSMVLQGGGGLLLLGVGSRAALIHGSALSSEPGSWRRLPEVAAGGWRCAVIATGVLV